MLKTLKVILWNEEIGRLSWDDRRRLAYFTYNPEFVKRGLNISPISAPIDSAGALTPIWGESEKTYQKLPAFVADSLPDAGEISCLSYGASRTGFQVRTSIRLTNWRL